MYASVFVCGLAIGWSSVQGVLLTVCKIQTFILKWEQARGTNLSEGDTSHWNMLQSHEASKANKSFGILKSTKERQ
jgi:hypothetical protein